MIRRVLAALFCLFTSFAAFATAPTVLSSNLTAKEQATVNNGETLIKSTPSIKKMGINSSNEGVQKAFAILRELKPAYLAEIIQIYPVKDNENLPETMNTTLMNIEKYAGIPYWSVHSQKWFDLYSSAKITSFKESANSIKARADLYMKPFGNIDMDIQVEKNPDYYLYVSTNLNKLKYNGKFSCVSEKNMKSIIVIFKDGDNWILYGIGGVNAPTIIGLKDRVETSFMNRIKSFCSYVFKEK